MKLIFEGVRENLRGLDEISNEANFRTQPIYNVSEDWMNINVWSRAFTTILNMQISPWRQSANYLIFDLKQ